MVTSIIWFGSAVGLFWHAYWTGWRTPRGTTRFLGGMTILSSIGFAIGTVLNYPFWFRIGMSITMLVMGIQAIQSYAFQHFLQNASKESTQLATLMGLVRRKSILNQVDYSDKLELKTADSQSLSSTERAESEV